MHLFPMTVPLNAVIFVSPMKQAGKFFTESIWIFRKEASPLSWENPDVVIDHLLNSNADIIEDTVGESRSEKDALLSEINESSLMENFTYISHQSYLFKGTVRGELLMAQPDAGEDTLWQVLEQVKLANSWKVKKGWILY